MTAFGRIQDGANGTFLGENRLALDLLTKLTPPCKKADLPGEPPAIGVRDGPQLHTERKHLKLSSASAGRLRQALAKGTWRLGRATRVALPSTRSRPPWSNSEVRLVRVSYSAARTAGGAIVSSTRGAP